ncbi:MAG: BatB protein, partial [Gammaproteobacteria bacterium]|nr:BatB protein [Gammaproteobacteria bacterium]
MIEIAWPLVFAALPLPWLIFRFAAPVRIRAAGALRVPWLEDFARAERSGREVRRVGLT